MNAKQLIEYSRSFRKKCVDRTKIGLKCLLHKSYELQLRFAILNDSQHTTGAYTTNTMKETSNVSTSVRS